MNIMQVNNWNQIIEEAKFTYSPFGKALKKQANKIEDHWKKLIYASEALKSSTPKLTIKNITPEDILNDEA